MKNITIYVLTSMGALALLAWYIYAPNRRRDNYIGIKPAIYKLKCEERCTNLSSSGETDFDSCVMLCNNNFDMSVDNSNRCSTCN